MEVVGIGLLTGLVAGVVDVVAVLGFTNAEVGGAGLAAITVEGVVVAVAVDEAAVEAAAVEDEVELELFALEELPEGMGCVPFCNILNPY